MRGPRIQRSGHRLAYLSRRARGVDQAETLRLGDGTAVESGSTGVLVTVTKTTTVLFEFDCLGAQSLGVLPDGGGGKAITWFKGYEYYGGFEYQRYSAAGD